MGKRRSERERRLTAWKLNRKLPRADRTIEEALDDAKSLFEDAGKEIPQWLRDRLR